MLAHCPQKSMSLDSEPLPPDLPKIWLWGTSPAVVGSFWYARRFYRYRSRIPRRMHSLPNVTLWPDRSGAEESASPTRRTVAKVEAKMYSCRNSIPRFLGEVVGTRETELSWYNETLVGGILQYGSLDRWTSRYGTVSPWAASVDELDRAWLDNAKWQNERIYTGWFG